MADHMHKEFMHPNTKGTIILDSTDTDVLVLACHHAPYFMNAVYWETGTTKKYAISLSVANQVRCSSVIPADIVCLHRAHSTN